MNLDEFGPDFTNFGRADMGRIWRDHKRGNLLADEEQRLAASMAAHPEWVEWWERAEDLGDARISATLQGFGVNVKGVDPFRWVAAQATVDALISAEDRDRLWNDCYEAARRAHARLRRDGLSDEAARVEIMYAYFSVLVDVRRTQITLENAIEDTVARFHQVLQRLAAGERATDIFPE